MYEEVIRKYNFLNIGVVASEVVPILNAYLKKSHLSYPQSYRKRLMEQALHFITEAAEGAKKIAEFKKDFDIVPFLGHNGVDVKPYKYYLSAYSLIGKKKNEKELDLHEFKDILKEIIDKEPQYLKFSPVQRKALKNLINLFYTLSELAVASIFPFQSPSGIENKKGNYAQVNT